jgi:two-component system, OmpR family, response regulator
MAAILVIDDEPDLVRFVRRALEAQGHQVRVALDGADGLRMAMVEPPDLIVLDLLMPGVDGRAILSAMTSSHPEVPILVLSAEADIRARIEVLEAGAVDFVAKPFAVRELLARVRSRLHHSAPPSSNGSGPEVMRVGSVTLDVGSRSMTIGTRSVTLSQREFLLLRHLMSRVDSVCSRQELLSEVWGYGFDPKTNVVDVCVARLRHKLSGEVSGDMIRTVRNVGYQLQSG